MDAVIAQRGEALLVGDPDGDARVYHPNRGWSAPQLAQAFLARGYWHDPDPGTVMPPAPPDSATP